MAACFYLTASSTSVSVGNSYPVYLHFNEGIQSTDLEVNISYAGSTGVRNVDFGGPLTMIIPAGVATVRFDVAIATCGSNTVVIEASSPLGVHCNTVRMIIAECGDDPIPPRPPGLACENHFPPGTASGCTNALGETIACSKYFDDTFSVWMTPSIIVN